MYKNSKNLDNELGYYTLLSTQTPKIDPQQYVYQAPSPPLIPIKTTQTLITSVIALYYLQNLQKYRTNSIFKDENKTRTLSKNIKIDPQEYV